MKTYKRISDFDYDDIRTGENEPRNQPRLPRTEIYGSIDNYNEFNEPSGHGGDTNMKFSSVEKSSQFVSSSHTSTYR